MLYASNFVEQNPWTLEMDLVSDLSDFMVDSMKKLKIEPSGKREITYEYFNLLKRLIAVRPRRIVRSKEFVCPSEYKKALQQFEEDVCMGRNLNRYISDRIMQAEVTDDLLNDWNISHFHLTRRFRGDGFAKRSDYQIFAWVTDECVYMIQIYAHNEKYLYSKQEMLKIVENNWPELLEPHRIKGCTRVQETFDDETYSKLRNAHVGIIIQTEENKVYSMIGGGYMSDGSSGEAMHHAIFWNNHMKKLEKYVIENMRNIVSVIQKMREGSGIQYEIRLFGLPRTEENILLVETRNRIVIELFLSEGLLRICKIEEEGLF